MLPPTVPSLLAYNCSDDFRCRFLDRCKHHRKNHWPSTWPQSLHAQQKHKKQEKFRLSTLCFSLRNTSLVLTEAFYSIKIFIRIFFIGSGAGQVSSRGETSVFLSKKQSKLHKFAMNTLRGEFPPKARKVRRQKGSPTPVPCSLVVKNPSNIFSSTSAGAPPAVSGFLSNRSLDFLRCSQKSHHFHDALFAQKHF